MSITRDLDRRTIGIDFDNTLVIYDDLFHRVAVETGLIHSQIQVSKKAVREAVRAIPQGEEAWQRLQGMVYGPRIGEALMAEGVKSFFQAAHQTGAKLFVISHKTQFSAYDETQTDLRQAAISWMERNCFFQDLGLSPDNVYFESTRADKIRRIQQLGCTHFIDDLEEVFLESDFPAQVKKILYAPSPPSSGLASTTVMSNWKEITGHLFGVESMAGGH